MAVADDLIRNIFEAVDTRTNIGKLPVIEGYSAESVAEQCILLGNGGYLLISTGFSMAGIRTVSVLQLTEKGKKYLNTLRNRTP